MCIYLFSFSNEIETTLNRLKKLEKDLTVKERELREASYILLTYPSTPALSSNDISFFDGLWGGLGSFLRFC